MPFAEQCGVFMVWVVQMRWLLGDGWQVIEGCGYVSGGYGRGRDGYGHGERNALISHCPNFGGPGMN